jgi:hypothetical protein
MSRPEFIDNQGERTLANALRDLAADPSCKDSPLDIASGYFNVAGFMQAADVIESRPEFRLLLGAEPEGPLKAAPDGRPLGLEARRGLEDLERQLASERDALPFSAESADEVVRLGRLLRSDDVEVKRYVRRFLHGKVYLFRGQAVIAGSANFTYGGLVHNREVAIAHYQPGAVNDAQKWFEGLWSDEDNEDYRERLIEIITARESETWTPHDVYLRALLELYSDELELLAEDDPDGEGYVPGQPGGITLVDFQRHGFRRALRVLERFDGVLVGDGVGLGKSFIGSQLLDHYVNREGLRALVIVPAQLRDSFWERHLQQRGIAGQVISYQQLAADSQLGGDRAELTLDKDAYRFVLVDEAHAFRNPDTDQYRALSRLMGGAQKKLCLMTATPVNNSIRDLYHQLMLFARHSARFREIGIPDLNAYFKAAEESAEHGDSASAMFKLIDATSVRRTRRFIQTHYPNARLDGEPISFPEAKLKTKLYELDAAYPGLFAKVRDDIDALTLARYQPDSYRLQGEPDAREVTFAGILRTGLLKRFESSVHAFRLTLETMIDACQEFLDALATKRVLIPGGSKSGTEADGDLAAGTGSRSAPLSEFKSDDLRHDVEQDLALLSGLREAVEHASIDADPKLDALAELLSGELGPEKAIIFSYYADTVAWIERALVEDAERGHERFGKRRHVVVTGTGSESAAERLQRVHQFCPETTGDEAGRDPVAAADEKDLLLTTDVLAEGQNLQQARYIINYDMPWNPMRLVQRNGRIDRLGSPFAGQEIYLYNLFPAGELDEILNLYDRLRRKIAYANISVGMEAPVFEDAAAVERNFADTVEQIRGIAGEDGGVLDEAEAQLDAFSGEEFRMELRAALAAERVRELLAMPHGAGSGFRDSEIPEGTVGVFFCVRVLLGDRLVPTEIDERAWRYVDLASPEEPIADELEVLRRIRCADGTPREMPKEITLTLYELWDATQRAIVAEYAERLDPAQAATRVPASQGWAIELLATESINLAERGARASSVRDAGSALSVPRGPLVLRQLSALRRQLRDADITPAAAALGVLETVDREGLRPIDGESRSTPPSIGPERVRLVCYQLVQG